MALWDLLQYLVAGLTVGSIYGMIGLGFTLIYNATGIVNFAQGEFVTLGALIAISASGVGLPMPLAVVIAVIAVTVLGAALEWGAIRPARNPSVITLIVITVGVSILLRGAAMWVWGPDPLPLRAFSGESPLMLGKVSILPQHLWIMGTLFSSMLALRLFADKTQAGKAMRACSINREAARLVGIPARRMVRLSFALSALLGALAGAVVAPLTMARYDMGIMLGLKGFCAAILGGLGNPVGAAVGGLLLGSLESLGAGFSPTGWSGYKDALAFAVMLVVLLVRPTGLLGKAKG